MARHGFPKIPKAQAFLVLLLPLLLLFPSTGAEKLLIHFNIDEESPPGLTVGNVAKAAKLDQTYSAEQFRKLQYSLLESDSSYFNLNRRTGRLQVGARIDRDTLCERSNFKWCCSRDPSSCFIPLQVSVTPQRYFQLITVKVFIWDINDHAPTWPKREYRVRIPENANVGHTLGIPAPSDPDLGSNSTQRFRLVDNSRTFDLDKADLGIRSDGALNGEEVRIRLSRLLDREMIAQYNLTLYAMDGGRRPRTGSVSIQVQVTDINDHAPHFDKSLYEALVSESSRPHHFVLRIKAKDEDEGNNARITYYFPSTVSRQVLRHFKLDSSNGEISLLSPLDYEAKKEFDFTVMARDANPSPQSASARVRILVKDENDCAPHLRLMRVESPSPIGGSGLGGEVGSRLSVPENEPPGYVAAIMKAEDCDSGEAGTISCTLKEGDQFRLERLDSLSNGINYKLVSLVRFDREVTDSVDLTIECADGGSPKRETRHSVKVQILDKNDEKPRFQRTHYVFNVSENQPENTPVGAVRAVDADIKSNGHFYYKLLTYRDSRLLKINRITGQLSTLSRLDRESKPRLHLRVAAVDSGKPSLSSTAMVTIHVNDVNDCTPKFEHSTYQFVLRENSPGGMEVGRLRASDDDARKNSGLKFRIKSKLGMSRNMFLPFHLDTVRQDRDYVAVLRTNQEIDRETPVFERDATCTFQVVVRDSGHPPLSSEATVSVTIQDVNDEVPKWVFPSSEHYAVNVSVAEEIGSLVVMVRAKDRDEGAHAEIHYFIKSGDRRQLFVLDPQTGALHVRRSLTPEDMGRYTLVLLARDNPSGYPNASHESITILKINVHKGSAGLSNLHDGYNYRDDGMNNVIPRGAGHSSDRNVTIIVTIVGCTVALALVLVLIIIVARIYMQRRHMNMFKRAAHHPKGPNLPCRQDGTLAKQELVYYTTDCANHQSTMSSPKSISTLSSGNRAKNVSCEEHDSLSIAMLADEEKKYVPQPKRSQPPAYVEALTSNDGSGGGMGGPEDRRDYTPLGCTTLDHAYYDVVHGVSGEKPEEALAMIPSGGPHPGGDHKMTEVKYTSRNRQGVFEASFV